MNNRLNLSTIYDQMKSPRLSASSARQLVVFGLAHERSEPSYVRVYNTYVHQVLIPGALAPMACRLCQNYVFASTSIIPREFVTVYAEIGHLSKKTFLELAHLQAKFEANSQYSC